MLFLSIILFFSSHSFTLRQPSSFHFTYVCSLTLPAIRLARSSFFHNNCTMFFLFFRSLKYVFFWLCAGFWFVSSYRTDIRLNIYRRYIQLRGVTFSLCVHSVCDAAHWFRNHVRAIVHRNLTVILLHFYSSVTTFLFQRVVSLNPTFLSCPV